MNWDITIFIFFIFSVFVFLFVLALLVSYRKRKRENELIRTKLHEEILKAQLEIQEQTFKNISQEIHDNIGQLLSLIKLNINTLESSNIQKLADTKELLSKVIKDIRDLSQSLHGDKIGEIGLRLAIEQELIIINNSGCFVTEFQASVSSNTFILKHEIIIFRIVQEILHNAIKHSQATLITVAYEELDNDLRIKISDNGIGFEIRKIELMETGIGLSSIEDRAKLIGAKLTFASSKGHGTTIEILYTSQPL